MPPSHYKNAQTCSPIGLWEPSAEPPPTAPETRARKCTHTIIKYRISEKSYAIPLIAVIGREENYRMTSKAMYVANYYFSALESSPDSADYWRADYWHHMQELINIATRAYLGLGTELSSSSNKLSTLGRTSSIPRPPFLFGFSFVGGGTFFPIWVPFSWPVYWEPLPGAEWGLRLDSSEEGQQWGSSQKKVWILYIFESKFTNAPLIIIQLFPLEFLLICHVTQELADGAGRLSNGTLDLMQGVWNSEIGRFCCNYTEFQNSIHSVGPLQTKCYNGIWGSSKEITR